MNNFPTIVSFYTNDWEYPRYANELIENCKSLNLDYHIIERPSTGDYIRNTGLKPHFIRDALEQLQRPILWIDCDGSLYKTPDLLDNLSMTGYDFGARSYKGPVERSWHVGTLWFNYTDKSKAFVNDWCKFSDQGTDENSFELAWQKNQASLKVFPLPPDYFVLLSKFEPQPTDSAVIVHRLSKSPDKMKRKYPNDPTWGANK